MKRLMIAAASLMSLALLAGCIGMLSHMQRNAQTSSLVDFLYPKGELPAHDQVPVLQLPLTVGVAFLPGKPGASSMLDQTQKIAILDKIRERFEKRTFVREIVPIPDYYLESQRGFHGLAALQRLYKLDLVALVSYDQVTRQDDNTLSLTYLTIVGAFFVPGTSQDVNTVVDLAVVDAATQSLVLRAAGMDSRKGITTSVGSATRLRERGAESIQASADTMIENFDKELLGFEDRVRKGTARVQIANRGSGGGGAFDWTILVLLGGLLLASRHAGLARGSRRGKVVLRDAGAGTSAAPPGLEAMVRELRGTAL